MTISRPSELRSTIAPYFYVRYSLASTYSIFTQDELNVNCSQVSLQRAAYRRITTVKSKEFSSYGKRKRQSLHLPNSKDTIILGEKIPLLSPQRWTLDSNKAPNQKEGSLAGQNGLILISQSSHFFFSSSSRVLSGGDSPSGFSYQRDLGVDCTTATGLTRMTGADSASPLEPEPTPPRLGLCFFWKSEPRERALSIASP